MRYNEVNINLTSNRIMDMMITTLQELLKQLPLNSRLSGPCPFCSIGKETTYQGNTFYGDDRFYLFPDEKGWGCRTCQREGRGSTGNGWYSHRSVAEKLNLELSETFISTHSYSDLESFTRNPLQYNTYHQTLENHKEVIRDYWHAFGWSDEVIDRFMLGYGKIDTWRTPGHLIPMAVTLTTDGEEIPGFYTALRAAGNKIKQKGSPKDYMWHIQDDKHLNTCVITEGEKDMITAYALGHKNVACTFSAYWNDNFGKFIAENYKTVTVYTDNDDAGRAWVKLILESLRPLGVSVSFIDWTKIEDAKEKDDITDYFSRNKTITRKDLWKAFRHKDATVEYSASVNTKESMTIEAIRGDQPGSIKFEVEYFLRNYTYKRGKGRCLLLSTGPGAGKTHTLYNTAEKHAKLFMHEKKRNYERLAVMLDELKEEYEEADDDHKEELLPFLEKQEKLLENYSFCSVAWYAPYKNGIDELLQMGADNTMWYNFQARNEGNCKQISTVNKLGENNHVIGEFCELSCPHSGECKFSGYLHQKEEMLKYPIVFYRHEHLTMLPSTSTELVIIDESITSVVETPDVFSSTDIHPHHEGWEWDAEDDIAVDVAKFLVQALRSVASTNLGALKNLPDEKAINPEYIIHGNQIYALLDKYYNSNGRELTEILILDNKLMRAFQPTYLSGELADIRKRCFHLIVEGLQRELGLYAYNKEADRPSTLNVVAGEFEIYSPPRVKLPARMPLIVADATPLLELYQAIFKREMKVYAPKFNSSNTEIVIVNGSDWSRSYVKTQLGRQMETFEEARKNKTALSDIPQLLDGYMDSSVFSDFVHILEHLKKLHDSILVVTHKNLREFIEGVLEGVSSGKAKNTEKTVSWGHYGALRGTNRYKDYEALCLVGAFRIPYDVLWRRAQLWAYGLGLMESIPQQVIKKQQSYNVPGEQSVGSYYTFNHWLGDKMVNHVEQGEMIQCAHRIRPHSSDDKKVVYIFATRPAMELATKVIEKKALLNPIKSTTYRELLSYLRTYYADTGKLPKYKDTKIKFKVSNSTIKKARGEVSETTTISK